MKTRKRLTKRQREALLAWIAEGLGTDEINARAARWKPRFKVTKQEVDHYRKTRAIKLQAIKEADEAGALKAGFAIKEKRVAALAQLAETLRLELTREEDNRLWTQNAKGLGSGESWEKYEYEEFNKAEIDAFRGLLEDIAAEVGERRRQGPNLNIDLTKLTDAQLERIAKGEDPLKVLTNA